MFTVNVPYHSSNCKYRLTVKTTKSVPFRRDNSEFSLFLCRHARCLLHRNATMIRRGILQAGGRIIGRSGPCSTTTTTSLAAAIPRCPASLQLRQSPPVGSTATTFLRAWFSSYPPHEVVGLPALSPVRLKSVATNQSTSTELMDFFLQSFSFVFADHGSWNDCELE